MYEESSTSTLSSPGQVHIIYLQQSPSRLPCCPTFTSGNGFYIELRIWFHVLSKQGADSVVWTDHHEPVAPYLKAQLDSGKKRLQNTLTVCKLIATVEIFDLPAAPKILP